MTLETCVSAVKQRRPVIVYASALLREPRQNGEDKRLRVDNKDAASTENLMKWLRSIKDLSGAAETSVAATTIFVNSVLDQEYIQYCCGLDTRLLERRCGYNNDAKLCDIGWDSVLPPSRIPSRNNIAVVSPRLNTTLTDAILEDARGRARKNEVEFSLIHNVHERYDRRQLLLYEAVVFVPTLSIATRHVDDFEELYRLNVPILCPSLALFKKWHDKYDLEIHVGGVEVGEDGNGKIPSPHLLLYQSRPSDGWERAFNYWASKLDAYVYEHITYFDSWAHFFQLCNEMRGSGSLDAVSRSMLKSNSNHRIDAIDAWRMEFKGE